MMRLKGYEVKGGIAMEKNLCPVLGSNLGHTASLLLTPPLSYSTYRLIYSFFYIFLTT
jgi:hypothetical protein